MKKTMLLLLSLNVMNTFYCNYEQGFLSLLQATNNNIFAKVNYQSPKAKKKKEKNEIYSIFLDIIKYMQLKNEIKSLEESEEYQAFKNGYHDIFSKEYIELTKFEELQVQINNTLQTLASMLNKHMAHKERLPFVSELSHGLILTPDIKRKKEAQDVFSFICTVPNAKEHPSINFLQINMEEYDKSEGNYAWRKSTSS